MAYLTINIFRNLFIVLISLVSGVVYSAKIDAPIGSDLQSKIDEAQDGDIITLHPGIYELPRGDSNSNGLRIFQRASKNNITIKCMGARHSCVIKKNGKYPAIQIDANNVTLQDFRIDGNRLGDSGVLVVSQKNKLENLLIENNLGFGILLKVTTFVLEHNKILGNVVRNNDGCGIALDNADNNWINNNVVHDNGSEAICIDRNSDHNWVNNNRLDHNCLIWGVGAIGIDSGKWNTVMCNTIVNHYCDAFPFPSLSDEDHSQVKNGINFQNNEGESHHSFILYNYIRTHDNEDIYLRYQDSPMKNSTLNPLNHGVGSEFTPYATHTNHVYGNNAEVFDDPRNHKEPEHGINWQDPQRPNGRNFGNTSYCNQFGYSEIHPERR